MTNATDRLRRNRLAIEARLDGAGLLHTVSTARHQLRRSIERALRTHARGEVLEAGAGRSPYAGIIGSLGLSLTTLDIDPFTKVDVIGDVQAMSTIPDARFDTVFSTQVLEHVPQPEAAFSEFARVTKPGGGLILTVPHLSMVHEAPHDYFRFTSYALENLSRRSGFDVLKIEAVGGPISLFGHLLSIGLLSSAGALPGMFWPTWLVNYVLVVRPLDLLDRLVGFRAVLPRDLLLIARRTSTV